MAELPDEVRALFDGPNYFVEPTRVGSMQLPFQHRPATA
jgi:hypothetical protein